MTSIMGAEMQSQNHVDVNYEKTVGLGAWLTKLEKQYFIVSEPKGEVISSKINRVAAIYTSKFKWV